MLNPASVVPICLIARGGLALAFSKQLGAHDVRSVIEFEKKFMFSPGNFGARRTSLLSVCALETLMYPS